MIILLCVNDRNNHNIVINVSSLKKLDDSIKLNFKCGYYKKNILIWSQ